MTPGTIWRRLTHFLRRDRMAREVDEELRLHLELRARKNRADGLTDVEATREAKRRLGNPSILREEAREASGWLFIERLVQDLHYGARQLVRYRASTAATILTLTLGIGANTAMFTVLNTALFAPAPVSDPHRLAWIGETVVSSGRFRGVSYPDYLALKDARGAFTGVMAYCATNLSLGGGTPERVRGRTPERVRGLVATGNYFDVLGVHAALGRTFGPAENTPGGGDSVAIMSDALWKRRFGGDPAIINQSINVNGRPFTVIGVMPPGFAGIELEDEPSGLWLPVSMVGVAIPGEDARLVEPGSAWLRVVGRLAPSVSIAKADAMVSAIAVPSRSASASSSSSGPERRMTAVLTAGGFDPSNRSEIAPILGWLAVVPALVLLIACANAANLLLARAVDRRKELALRRSLGATRPRLVRQLLTESVMLASVAAGSGLLLAQGLLAVIGRLAHLPGPFMAGLVVDWRVLAATTAAAVGTGLVFGLAPALAASNPRLSPALKEDGLTLTPNRARHRLRNSLVIAQVATSLLLLVMTGLFLRGISRVVRVDPGFDARNGITFSFDLDLQGYTPDRRAAFTRELLRQTAAVPGVEAAAVTTALPLGGRFTGTDVAAEDPAASSGSGREVSALFASISPAYFAAMGTPVPLGRAFDSRDSSSAPRVAIVNQALATRLWPGENPLGRRLRISGDRRPWLEVVGVAGDAKDDDLTTRPRAYFYLPIEQEPSGVLSLVARTMTPDPRERLAVTAAIAQRLDPDLPLVGLRTFADLLGDNIDKQRATASMLGVFGVLALVLATMGIYGVAAHAARLRTREVGIRMALGARAFDVHRLFVSEGLRLSFKGVVAGLVVSGLAVKLIASFIFGLGLGDALVFAAAALVLGAVALFANYLPARRAAKIDPLAALRVD